MPEEPATLRERTTDYALHVVTFYSLLPKTTPAQVLGKQLLRSGTSVGAHYREAFRAKSDADFACKLQGALQELEESDYWLELIRRAALLDESHTLPLLTETGELIAIFTTAVKRVKGKLHA